jgi:NAD(P)-dependent dehydrogenase (short-subunit alcohol dehydrogenase family)
MKWMNGLEKKIAIVTGRPGGICRAFAEAYVRDEAGVA